mmetsp:Transcript_19108/g.29888  ORF Transcript_19108/g.29888 Transcript_19108/m.29888 type:complete len:202 (-) Transcript_19108:1359-1964(-)
MVTRSLPRLSFSKAQGSDDPSGRFQNIELAGKRQSRCRECGGTEFCLHGKWRQHCQICRPELKIKRQQHRKSSGRHTKDSGNVAGGAPRSMDEDLVDNEAGGEDEWRTEGSEYLMKKVRIQIDWPDTQLKAVVGTVCGWLNEKESDFLDAEGKPAALWRVSFEAERVTSQDFEEHELLEAIHDYESHLPGSSSLAQGQGAS